MKVTKKIFCDRLAYSCKTVKLPIVRLGFGGFDNQTIDHSQKISSD